MPRPKKSALTPANAVRLIQTLIDEGRILAGDVARYLHIAELEDRLRSLRGGGEVPVPHARQRAGGERKRRASKPVSAAVVETRRLQGQYIAHLRKFPKTARAKFQKIARTKSREEAISAMKRALSA
jgi:hypothetical protein